MKTLAEQMAVYGAYHRNPWNRLTHFVGVPAIVFAILIPLSWLGIEMGDMRLTLAMLITSGLLFYYFLLDWQLGLMMLLVLSAILYCADYVATNYAVSTGLIVFVIAFVGGWAVQLLGHVFEGRRPALVDNIWQIFVAPVFLAAEACFMCGARSELKNDVESRIR